MSTLYYIHDPMCSWCWAFRPTLTQVIKNLPKSIHLEYLIGGLAPDSKSPMDEATQVMIQRHWQTITKRVPGTQFNFDFWILNTPYRSTYPSCRAVIAAKALDSSKEDAMILAIQQAYYLNAQNPSLEDVLIRRAESIGLNPSSFKSELNSTDTNAKLKQNIQQVQIMGATGFPSLILKQTADLEQKEQYFPISIDYTNSEKILNTLSQYLKA
ncbi:MAG: DsbA family protein [Ghiorsea sp.]